MHGIQERPPEVAHDGSVAGKRSRCRFDNEKKKKIYVRNRCQHAMEHRYDFVHDLVPCRLVTSFFLYFIITDA